MKAVRGIRRVVAIMMALSACAPWMNAQTIELKVDYQENGCELVPGLFYDCFKVFMRPTVPYSSPIPVGDAQITILTPISVTSPFPQLQSNNGGTWADGLSITCDANYCYHAFTNNPAPINMALAAGQELQLFTFATTFPGSCIDGVRLHETGVDPQDPGDGGDYNISFVIVPNEQYLGNYENAPNNCSAMPLEFLSFSAEKAGYTSVLDWATVWESNNSHFEVQRSINGSDFETIGKVPGAGNSSNILNYHFVDERPSKGKNYYRIQQVDFDGNSSSTNIEVVRFDTDLLGGGKMRVFPNPSTDGVHVYLPEETQSEETTVTVYDNLGRVVYAQNLGKGVASHFVDYTQSGIVAGSYVLQVMNGQQEVGQEKIIVQQ